VIAAVADLFFAAKIQAAAQRAGVVLIEAADARQLGDRLAGEAPELVIFDLNCAECEPLPWISRIRADARFQETRILGFLSHVQKQLEAEASEAGCDRVISKSKFSAELVGILAGESTDLHGSPRIQTRKDQ